MRGSEVQSLLSAPIRERGETQTHYVQTVAASGGHGSSSLPARTMPPWLELADTLTSKVSAERRAGSMPAGGTKYTRAWLETGRHGGFKIRWLRPCRFKSCCPHARLAQLGRAPGLHPGGRGIEALSAYQIHASIAQRESAATTRRRSQDQHLVDAPINVREPE
jgi:hypothetical protein